MSNRKNKGECFKETNTLYFPRKERDPNVMDVDRLMFDK